MANFCHLHNHTEFSQLDGVGTADQYAQEAKRLNQSALGITDHGNIDGILKFQKACAKHGITPVLGCELYICPDIKIKDNQRYHLVTLIRNRQGLTNLMQMLSIANLEGFHKRPRIDPNTLLPRTEGLVFLTACVGSFINMEGGERLLQQLNDQAPTFLEIMPHNQPIQITHNDKCMSLSQKYNIPLVATNDCHYPYRSGVVTQEVLLAIQRKAKWNDKDRWKFKFTGLHLRSAIEMQHTFARQGQFEEAVYLEAMERTIEVAELCNGYTVKKIPVELPKVHGYEDRDETELLWEIIVQGWERRLGDHYVLPEKAAEYETRVNDEFQLICQQGFQRYFLIVWELLNFCKKQGIMTGPGRGSVGGSLIAYLMGITDVDPIKYGLIFARFISPERQGLPDIDCDFQDSRREEVRQHLRDCYGEHNVAGVSTFLTMKGKAALRNVARVFEVPLKEIDVAAKAIMTVPDGHDRTNHTIEDGMIIPEISQFQKKYPDVVKHAQALEGQVQGSGQHAAATCISLDDLREGQRCNLVLRNGTLVANWGKGDAEYMGLMKLDVLGLSSLSILNGAKRMIKANYGIEIDFDKLPLDDPKIYQEIALGNTCGSFQINSTGLTQLCKDMQVREFNDIVLATALYRPGPLGCLTGDALIRCWSGKLIRIDEIDKGRPIVSSALPEISVRKYIRNQVKEIIETGIKQVFELKTSDENIIKATDKHNFFIKRLRPSKYKKVQTSQYELPIWDELKNLKIGDLILIINVNKTNKKGGKQGEKLSQDGLKTRFIKGSIPWNKGKKSTRDYTFHPMTCWKSNERKKEHIDNWKEKMFGDKKKWKEIVEKGRNTQLQTWKDDKKREEQSELMKEYYAINPHPNSNGINVSKPQKEIFEQIKKIHFDAELEYRFNYIDNKGKNRFFNLDIGIPSFKTNVEFDGDYWHDNPGERVEPRDTILENSGWQVIRITYKTCQSFIDDIISLLPNNSTKWSTIVSINNLGEEKTYDIITENQEFPNYIANRFVVHNSGVVEDFLRRRKGQSRITYIHPKLEKYTKDTLGIVIYQEQVMWSMYELAGLSWGDCDKVRKVMGKSKGEAAMEKFEQQFVDGCLAQATLSENEAIHIWDMFSSHGKYSFNLAHAVEYSLISYWTLYLKHYWPKEFLAACLTWGDKDDSRDYVEEARRLGIQVELPLSGTSLASEWLAPVNDNIVYAPLTAIKGVGLSQAEKIISGKISKQQPSKKKKDQPKAVQKGFFDKKIIEPEVVQNLPIKQPGGGAIAETLRKIGYHREKPLGYEELKEATSYFDFNVLTGQERWSRLGQLEGHTDRDITACRLSRYQGNLIKVRKFVLPQIECQACELINECTKPVQPSFGRYNLMLSGEAPNQNDDKDSIGFVGDAGTVLWSALSKWGLAPEMFHVTSVAKCWPSRTKTPGKKHIAACSKIIETEINGLQPIMILAFGNTNVSFFRGESGGITKLVQNQTVEWSDKYQCWICWSIHPAAVLHSPGNRSDFEAGIENFARKLAMIGGTAWANQIARPRLDDCPIGGQFGIENNMYAKCSDCSVWVDCAMENARSDWMLLNSL